jgi:fluoroquinolone transport system permease protein
MRSVFHLIKGDMKQIYRDPMLLISLVGPFLLILLVRFILPFATAQFALGAYHELLASFFILLIPLLLGIMAGFIMLDERDDKMIDYFAVTPLSKQGYLLYRLLLPGVLTVLYGYIYLEWASPVSLPILDKLLVTVMLAMEAPIICLFLVAIAANKIEGLALSKGVGLVVFVPFIIYFVSEPWNWAGGILPTFWPAKLFLIEGVHLMTSPFIGGLGAGIHIFYIFQLSKRFLRKTD